MEMTVKTFCLILQIESYFHWTSRSYMFFFSNQWMILLYWSILQLVKCRKITESQIQRTCYDEFLINKFTLFKAFVYKFVWYWLNMWVFSKKRFKLLSIYSVIFRRFLLISWSIFKVRMATLSYYFVILTYFSSSSSNLQRISPYFWDQSIKFITLSNLCAKLWWLSFPLDKRSRELFRSIHYEILNNIWTFLTNLLLFLQKNRFIFGNSSMFKVSVCKTRL